eukprot:SAG31_NODE_22449_length_525_cov_0.845070_1_plen_114_part_10
MYKVVNRAFVRAGPELTSQRKGTVEPGQIVRATGEPVKVLAATAAGVASGTSIDQGQTNVAMVTRVPFDRGWVSETSSDGSPVLERLVPDESVQVSDGACAPSASAAVTPDLLY